MSKANFEETFEIYLFTEDSVDDNYSKLSEFISYLKFNKVNLPYKFSYVGRGDALIPELTLNENILMDFTPNSLTASKEIQFQEFLEEQQNKHLLNLYQKIASAHILPTNSDAQMRKVSSLIKSLIFEGQFIFLEDPEIDLDQETLSLFIQGLKDHISINKKNVFIFSRQLELWMPHANSHVKREKDYSFSTIAVSRNWKWKKEREEFYKSPNNEVANNIASKDQLRFHLPKITNKKNPAKKSAA